MDSYVSAIVDKQSNRVRAKVKDRDVIIVHLSNNRGGIWRAYPSPIDQGTCHFIDFMRYMNVSSCKIWRVFLSVVDLTQIRKHVCICEVFDEDGYQCGPLYLDAHVLRAFDTLICKYFSNIFDAKRVAKCKGSELYEQLKTRAESSKRFKDSLSYVLNIHINTFFPDDFSHCEHCLTRL